MKIEFRKQCDETEPAYGYYGAECSYGTTPFIYHFNDKVIKAVKDRLSIFDPRYIDYIVTSTLTDGGHRYKDIEIKFLREEDEMLFQLLVSDGIEI